MNISQLHLAQGAWLWGLLAIPIVIIAHALSYRTAAVGSLKRFADRHLLPHLVRSSGSGTNIRAPILLWVLAWLCGVVAMAGPSWNYTDEQTFNAAQDLVIVLDLSQSMNAQDVRPSRMVRAREEIEDLLRESRGMSIGLVAYAAVPHMVTPLTDDVRTIANLLPELDTSLITLQGDRLAPALEMAAGMLGAEPGSNKSILIISDGGFEERDFSGLARLAGNAAVYAMGIGTVAGAPVAVNNGFGLPQDAPKNPISRLQVEKLQMLAAAGHGLYVKADYTDSDARAILSGINSAGGNAQARKGTVRVWDERFYIPAFALALFLLPLFRRGAAFLIAVILITTFSPIGYARAATDDDFFLNRDQQAQDAYNRGDYKDAIAKFGSAYLRGVAAYRAGAYDKAAAFFKVAASQKGNLNALYDLGNALLMEGHPEDAIRCYEAELKQSPNDASAQHNLAIARKILAQKREKPQQNGPKSQNKQNGAGAQNGRQDPQQQAQNGEPHDQGQQGGVMNRPPPRSGPDQKNGQQRAQSQQGRKDQSQQQAGNTQTGRQQEPPQGKELAASAPRGAPANSYMAQAKNEAVGRPHGRTQQDAIADEWLARVQSDPGSFLRNQFMIEDRNSGLKLRASP